MFFPREALANFVTGTFDIKIVCDGVRVKDGVTCSLSVTCETVFFLNLSIGNPEGSVLIFSEAVESRHISGDLGVRVVDQVSLTTQYRQPFEVFSAGVLAAWVHNADISLKVIGLDLGIEQNVRFELFRGAEQIGGSVDIALEEVSGFLELEAFDANVPVEVEEEHGE